MCLTVFDGLVSKVLSKTAHAGRSRRASQWPAQKEVRVAPYCTPSEVELDCFGPQTAFTAAAAAAAAYVISIDANATSRRRVCRRDRVLRRRSQWQRQAPPKAEGGGYREDDRPGRGRGRPIRFEPPPQSQVSPLCAAGIVVLCVGFVDFISPSARAPCPAKPTAAKSVAAPFASASDRRRIRFELISHTHQQGRATLHIVSPPIVF